MQKIKFLSAFKGVPSDEDGRVMREKNEIRISREPALSPSSLRRFSAFSGEPEDFASRFSTFLGCSFFLRHLFSRPACTRFFASFSDAQPRVSRIRLIYFRYRGRGRGGGETEKARGDATSRALSRRIVFSPIFTPGNGARNFSTFGEASRQGLQDASGVILNI